MSPTLLSISRNWDELTKLRLVVATLLFCLVLPVIVTGVTHDDRISASANETRHMTIPTENVTFATAQGKQYSADQARLVAFDTKSDPIWVHDTYGRYYDVDPLGNGRILFVASTKGIVESEFTGEFVAVTMNWRTGEVYNRFPIPSDTHDVDYLGNGEYAIADIAHDRVAIYNRTTEQFVWNYSFRANFPPPTQAGGPPSDYTHVNDVDAIDNGSAFLVSPRNFDRVMAINRSTKAIEWTLGEEDNYEILKEQHNPVLLSQDPVTVLVADSENHRVVEYRRTDDGWSQDWVYRGDLDWPRDADRLPNGNTLIVDSGNDRVLEVTPSGSIVWEVSLEFAPYDVERSALGNEPTGPTMHEVGQDGTVIAADQASNTLPTPLERIFDAFTFVYTTAQWVIPSWIEPAEFGLLWLVPVVLAGWISVELTHIPRVQAFIRRIRTLSTTRRLRPRFIRLLLLIVCLLIGGILLLVGLAPGKFTVLSSGLGLIVLCER